MEEKLEISTYIKYIQQEVKDNGFDDYVHVFYEYKNYLESRIEKNPKDIEAICQLAAVYLELRYGEDISIKLILDTLTNYIDEISIIDKSRIYVNLAFLYESNYDQKKCLYYLEEAIKLNLNTANAYNELARIRMENNFTGDILSLFEKAYSLSPKMKYQYNYGVALFEYGYILKSKVLFEELLPKYEDERQVLYGYGICCFYTGDKRKAIEIANKLAQGKNDDYIAESEIADLYFLCDEYSKHNEMYDNSDIEYYSDVKWLAPYFYCLKVQGKTEELQAKLSKVIAEKNNAIMEIEAEELDDDFTELEKNENIQEYQKEKNEIIMAFEKILNEDYKPEIKIKLWLMYGCYMIDCPRHQSL